MNREKLESLMREGTEAQLKTISAMMVFLVGHGEATLGERKIFTDEQLDKFTRFIEKAKELSLGAWGAVTDLSPLTCVPEIEELEIGLRGDEIDFSPLRELTNLESLKIESYQYGGKGYTGQIDTGFLSAMPKLEVLRFRSVGLTTLEDVAGLNELRELGVARSTAADLSPLAGLDKLRRLDLNKLPASDLAPLSNLVGLNFLDLENNAIEDISHLSKLTSLTYLYLGGNQVSDVSALSGLTELNYLSLPNNQIKDVSPLEPLVKLDTLYLEDNPVEDYGPVSNFPALEDKDFRLKRKAKKKKATPAQIADPRTATAAELASLDGDVLTDTLMNHFADWLVTDTCRSLFSSLMEHCVDVTADDDALVLRFECQDDDMCEMRLGPPHTGKVDEEKPASLATVLQLHGEVIVADEPPDGIALGTYGNNWDDDGEDDDERYVGLCDAGQNWFNWDTREKNALGEWKIVFNSHEGGATNMDPFPHQDDEPFGVGGFLFRALAYRVLSDDDRWSDCGWG